MTLGAGTFNTSGYSVGSRFLVRRRLFRLRARCWNLLRHLTCGTQCSGWRYWYLGSVLTTARLLS